MNSDPSSTDSSDASKCSTQSGSPHFGLTTSTHQQQHHQSSIVANSINETINLLLQHPAAAAHLTQIQQHQQQLLASAQLLAAVNPSLSAMAHALTLAGAAVAQPGQTLTGYGQSHILPQTSSPFAMNSNPLSIIINGATTPAPISAAGGTNVSTLSSSSSSIDNKSQNNWYTNAAMQHAVLAPHPLSTSSNAANQTTSVSTEANVKKDFGSNDPVPLLIPNTNNGTVSLGSEDTRSNPSPTSSKAVTTTAAAISRTAHSAFTTTSTSAVAPTTNCNITHGNKVTNTRDQSTDDNIRSQNFTDPAYSFVVPHNNGYIESSLSHSSKASSKTNTANSALVSITNSCTASGVSSMNYTPTTNTASIGNLSGIFGSSISSSNTGGNHHSQLVIEPLSNASKNLSPLKKIGQLTTASMQGWSLEKLESHVQQLKDTHQPIPRPITNLIADLRHKEEKRYAKRIANRKSACTSRARKKALIEEMTKENARLRREALILSYLPDPVVTIRTDGEITFCSMQMERVLRYNVEDLLGANIEQIVVPDNDPSEGGGGGRTALRRLIQDLVITEKHASSLQDGGIVNDGDDNANLEDEEEEEENNIVGSGTSSNANNNSSIISERFFPLLEVTMKNETGQASMEVGPGEDVSDSSGDRQPPDSGNVMDNTMYSFDKRASPAKKVTTTDTAMVVKSNSDGSGDCSTSSNNTHKASLNMMKNVDDVMGSSVTANNADARLSSLMHFPGKQSTVQQEYQHQKLKKSTPHTSSKPRDNKLEEQSSLSAESSSLGKSKKRSTNSSEDSGYRESNESPEESNDYAEDVSSSSGSFGVLKAEGRRARPLAPACNVRLIRNDLTTIWCELTSSIRTRSTHDENNSDSSNQKTSTSEAFLSDDCNQKSSCVSNEPSLNNESSIDVTAQKDEEKEILLCFRPIQEGEKVGEELRFTRKIKNVTSIVEKDVTSSSFENPLHEETNISQDCSFRSEASSMEMYTHNKRTASSLFHESQSDSRNTKVLKRNLPANKRKIVLNDIDEKKRMTSFEVKSIAPCEKSAVDSLMLMSNTK